VCGQPPQHERCRHGIRRSRAGPEDRHGLLELRGRGVRHVLGFRGARCSGVFVQGGYRGEYRKDPASKDGFAPLSVKNAGPRESKHPIVDNKLLSDPGTLLAPGQTAQFKVSLTFAKKGDRCGTVHQRLRGDRAEGPDGPRLAGPPAHGNRLHRPAEHGMAGESAGYVSASGTRKTSTREAGLAAFGKGSSRTPIGASSS